jgi:hypothetical protein
MRPAIRPGDVLHVARCPLADLVPGQVILFTTGGRLFAHRLVETRHGATGRVFVARGDGNWRNDPLVHESQVLGEVVGISRDGGAPVPPVASTPAGRLTTRVGAEWETAVRRARRWLGPRASAVSERGQEHRT